MSDPIQEAIDSGDLSHAVYLLRTVVDGLATQLEAEQESHARTKADALQTANELKLAKLDLFMEREGLGPEDMENDL